jgi:diguanylate cyclase (GGDEF)-like protein/PAS domain S-box-containing protein
MILVVRTSGTQTEEPLLRVDASARPFRPVPALLGRARRLRELMPTGGGLRDEDWAGRHRLLTSTMIGSTVLLTGVGIARDRLDVAWLVSVVLVFTCTMSALFLPPRRLPSSAVAIGFTVVCADLVMMYDGLTEAHFSFFIAVGALALYRDWLPFGAFLACTVGEHAVMGALMSHRTFDHEGVYHGPWFWATVHGIAVLLCAVTQVIAWRLTEGEESRAGEDLTQAEAQFGAAFEEAPVAMLMVDAEGRLLRWNPAYAQWLGLPGKLPIGITLADLPIRPIVPGQQLITDRLREGTEDVIRDERTYLHDNGSVIHLDIHASALRDDHGQLKLAVMHLMDVTEKRATEEILQRKVREDSLTRLLSRGAFEDDLADLIGRHDSQVSVIYIDVDRFKAINDSHGHGAGDEVLRTFGQRIAGLAPDDALVARLGGDEFAIALPGTIARGERLGQAIVRSCDEAFVLSGGNLAVTVSVGVCAAGPGEDAEATLQSADMAMYAAKQGGRARIRMFDDTMRLDTQRRVAAEAMLRSALDGDRTQSLPVWFQPIVSLSTRQIIGAESLVRLRSTEGRLVSPNEFIPIAEETGLVIPLGQHVLRTALAQLRAWGDRLPYVSVNVSPRQLSEIGFVPMLVNELEASGLPDRSRLVLEITETSVLQSSVDLRHRLDAIKALGVRLALDDFGTGYSSLTWLQSVPADIVKLDRSFVAGLARDPDKAAIISAVLWLAKALGMSVIAEGVEEMEDAEMLAQAECPAVQGYLFSRPVPADEFELLLPSSAGGPGAPWPSGAGTSSSVPSARTAEVLASDELSRRLPTIVNVP